ncbi:outer membrane protein assembly factor BamA, partial [bacterium]|nr:outer membrane protein assembly factor BamA [bacterium]
LKEGRRYYLGNINFEGNLIFRKEEIEKVLVLKKKGEVFNRKKADKNIQEILNLYYEKGYVKAKVEEIPSIGEKENVLNITYYIQPGEIYYAEEIKIKGNTKTKDKVIRRELKIEPGDKITSDRIRKSYIRLRDLNYFDAINIYPEFKETPGKADVVVDVKERKKTGLFLIGGGYSSIDKLVGMVSIEQRNFDITNPPSFVGGGQDLALTFEIGTEARNYKLSFTEPYFLDKPVWIGPDIYRLRREWDDYTVQSTGGDLRIGRRWENFSLGFTFTSEKNELSDVDIPSLQYQEGTLRKNSLLVSLIYSSLDSRLYPTKGDRLKIGVEYAGGIFQGDIDFIKPTFENNFYWPFKKFIFHSRTYIGMIKEMGDTENIPIYERFFGGGIGTVRGYEERTLGPKEDGKAVGGKSIFAQNFELVYPLYKEILKGVIFFDVGNVWEKWGSFGNLKKGVGAGLRITVPILRSPIEVYYGYALDREEGESRGRFHIGMSFGF